MEEEQSAIEKKKGHRAPRPHRKGNEAYLLQEDQDNGKKRNHQRLTTPKWF